MGRDRRCARRAHRNGGRRLGHDAVVRIGRTDDPRDAYIMKQSVFRAGEGRHFRLGGHDGRSRQPRASARYARSVRQARRSHLGGRSAARHGRAENDHIRKTLFAPNVAARWREAVKRDLTEATSRPVREVHSAAARMHCEILDGDRRSRGNRRAHPQTWNQNRQHDRIHARDARNRPAIGHRAGLQS